MGAACMQAWGTSTRHTSASNPVLAALLPTAVPRLSDPSSCCRVASREPAAEPHPHHVSFAAKPLPTQPLPMNPRVPPMSSVSSAATCAMPTPLLSALAGSGSAPSATLLVAANCCEPSEPARPSWGGGGGMAAASAAAAADIDVVAADVRHSLLLSAWAEASCGCIQCRGSITRIELSQQGLLKARRSRVTSVVGLWRGRLSSERRRRHPF